MVLSRGGSAILASTFSAWMICAVEVNAQDKGAATPKAAPAAPVWPWGAWGFGVPPPTKLEPKVEPTTEVKPPAKIDPKAAPKTDAKTARPKPERASTPTVARQPTAQPSTRASTPPTAESLWADGAVDWTVAIAAGAPGSQGLLVASDLARHLSEPDGLRLRPVVTLGEGENLRELLAARPVDAAIVHADALASPPGSTAPTGSALTYIAELFHDPVQVVARRGITTIAHIDGGRVSTGVPGSAAAATAAKIFQLLDLSVRMLAIDHAAGCAALIEGTLDAVIHVGTAAPCPPEAMSTGLVAVPLPAAPLAAHYAPMTIGGTDTVGVAALLVVANDRSPHGRNLERLIDVLAQRFDSMRARSSPKQALSLASDVPGWTRHPRLATLPVLSGRAETDR